MTQLFRLFSRLPLALLHALGAALGWVVYLASGTYRARLRANVAQAGIPWAAARPAIAAAGRMVAELPWLWVAQRGKPLGAHEGVSFMLADNAMEADAWATALTVMGARDGFDFAKFTDCGHHAFELFDLLGTILFFRCP